MTHAGWCNLHQTTQAELNESWKAKKIIIVVLRIMWFLGNTEKYAACFISIWLHNYKEQDDLYAHKLA